MALNALRIDDVVLNPDGSLAFSLSEGTAPLALTPTGDGLLFSSRQDFREQMLAWVESFGAKEKLFMLVAEAFKQDPTMRASTLTAQKQRQIVVDYTSPAKVITT